MTTVQTIAIGIVLGVAGLFVGLILLVIFVAMITAIWHEFRSHDD